VKNSSGITHLINATKYSLSGLKTVWKHEVAFRQEICIILILFPFALWIGKTAVHRILLAGSCLIVIFAELLNSSIESIVDRAGTEYDILAKHAKDTGSAAVFISILLAIITWALILYEYYLN
jgi:diacylglycerol kinase (ATP)